MANNLIAQTPAPKSDRVYGSSTNKKGSASTEGKGIELSEKTIDTLKKKLEEFKKSHPTLENVSLSDLKKVYRRGSGAYSKSHRPTITGGAPNSRAAWSFARVNKFLEKAAGKKVKAAYVQDDDLLKYADGGSVSDRNLYFDLEEGINLVFSDYPELNEIGSKQEYFKYLKSSFPSSIQNLIKFRGRRRWYNFEDEINDLDKSEYNYYFTDNIRTAYGWGRMYVDNDEDIKIWAALLDNPKVNYLGKKGVDVVIHSVRNPSYWEYIAKPRQIHLLGSKEDIEMFKEWKSKFDSNDATYADGGLTAKETIQSLPTELRERYLKLWDIPQRKDYHPEGNTLKHAVVVLNRAIKKYPNDKDIIAAALFHDIGKDKVFAYHKKTGEPTAYGHEDVSAELVIEYQDWVSDFGADVDCVYFLVKNHMKAHKLNEMRQSKQDAIKASPYYDKLMKLESIDKGGIEYAEGGTINDFKRVKKEYLKSDEESVEIIEYNYKEASIVYSDIDKQWILSFRYEAKPQKVIGGYNTLKAAKEVALYYLQNPHLYADGGNIWGLDYKDEREMEEEYEKTRLVDTLYEAKRKIYDSYLEETEDAIAKYYEAKKMYDDFLSSIAERKDSIRRINNLEYILDSEKESYENTRYTYEYKELYEKDPRLAAIETAKESIEWNNSNDSKDYHLKQGESEEEIEERRKRMNESYSQDIKDLTYDLMVNPISPIGKMAHGGTTNKNNTKMIHKQHLNLKPIQKIDVGDTYLLKEDVFDSDRNHIGTRYCTIKVSVKHPMDNYELEVIECEGDAKKFAKGTILSRDRKHIISNGKMISEGEKKNNFKDGGEINADSQVIKQYFGHESGDAGGLLVGKRHSEGGIKAHVNSTGQQIEMEGGEAVITRGAVSSNKKYSYDGKEMTTREILSDLNVKGGGVAFADGGDVPEKINCGCSHMSVGGETYTPQDFITLSEKHYQEGRLIDGIEKERKDHFYTLAKLNSGAITIEQALREIASKEMMLDPKYPYSE